MKNILTIILIVCAMGLRAQTKTEMEMSLEDAIRLAKSQSLSSFKNKNTYLTQYWSFRSYKAKRLPSLSLEATPINYNRSVLQRYDSETNTDVFIPDESLSTSVGASINQNIFLTGGTLSLNSDFRRLHNYEKNTTNYATSPVVLNLRQPLNGYNRFRWESRIEPVRFEQAKREFIEEMESISMKVADEFFGLARSEINLKIAITNRENADTLYTIGKGRFNIGTVTQDELLDMELSLLNANLDVKRATLNLEQSRASFNSFLGLDKDVVVRCLIPQEIPTFQVTVDKAVTLALENNSTILSMQRQLMEANRRVAEKRAQSGLSADIRANLGLDKNSDSFDNAYRAPFGDQRGVGISLNIPIVDWGQRKGQIQMAKSERNVTEISVKQARIDFEQQVLIKVMEFNMQQDILSIVAKADTVAQLGYDVTKQRFMIDKVDIIKLNSARNALDAARRNYISSMAQFWSSYFNLRRLTLYDFETNSTLQQDIDQLLEL
ncbi:MAG: TolC family protein [Breznakibacter sp.]